MNHMNRSSKNFIAWALIEGKDKLALWDGSVPVYWMRKTAQEEANKRNGDGFENVRVEKIRIVRPATR
jgi:phage terminase Nu1 subunit (DNA packaging protein)